MDDVTYIAIMSYEINGHIEKTILYAGSRYTSAVGEAENAVFPTTEKNAAWVEHWCNGEHSWNEKFDYVDVEE